jgi:hypothetical protein
LCISTFIAYSSETRDAEVNTTTLRRRRRRRRRVIKNISAI